ncbi:hypothetical protein QYE76_036423 [Lolium multiflorum]|uniref:F-box domain-containing protein n=1 Tax=Lolium multiflorum TaxID=4521 RepID=A0AAD8R0W4_LOLMU|nr:hypothetical protein QYE76_036423 [Lolium multiflorum]
MSDGDRLSDLPDDLLLRVLYFTPAREGASTGALSKRWRGLWLSSGVLNLDERLAGEDHYTVFFSKRDAFVSAARSSLEAAAAGSPVTRLTFRVGSGRSYGFKDFLHANIDMNMARSARNPDVITELLSNAAARRVEELRLTGGDPDNLECLMNEEIQCPTVELPELSFLCLPSDSLRVLDVTSSRGLQSSPGVTFLRLASLRLNHCRVIMEHLQDLIHAAPARQYTSSSSW